MIVHQILPTFEPGAVGSHSLLVRDVLRAAGHESEIFAAEIRPAYEDRDARTLGAYRGGADVLVYQLAIGSVAADFAMKRREPLVVNYHNLTPVRFWMGWEPVAAGGVAWGLQQLRELAARTSLGVADSHYNEEDLLAAGYGRTSTVPLLVDVEHLFGAPAEPIERTTGTSWLFVGRLAPNKAQHDLVKALAAARRFHDPDAQLTLVGGGVESAYGQTLRRFVHALGLDDAVKIAGTVSPAQLAAHYEAADVLVVASEHEGFCVPLLEAMSTRVPIVAYAAAAVPETLGDAGLLLTDKGPCTIAAAVSRLMTDPSLRAQLVDAGVRRVRDFDVRVTGPAFVDAIESVTR